MRLVFWTLLAGAAVVAFGGWLSSLHGTVSVSLGRYVIETSTALAIGGAVVLLLILVALLWLLGRLIGIPRRIRERRAWRRRDSGDAALTSALVAIAAGEAAPARRAAARARRLLGDGAQPLMLAAEAERLGGDEAAAAALFQKLAARDDAALLGLRGLFRQAVLREDFAAAAAIAGQAEAAHPGGAWMREERERLAARIGDWRQALALSAEGAPARPAYAAAAAEAASDAEEGERLARRAVRDFPNFVPAALGYARRLRASGREDRAQEVLARAWKTAPQPDLAALALEPLTDPIARIKTAGKLAGGASDHLESHLLLARVNLAAGLTGEARRQLVAARARAQEDRRYWLLLADLEAEERGDTEAGRLAQREALRRAAGAPPEPCWRCQACGTVLTGWQPVCPACHEPGRIQWGPGARAVLLPATTRPQAATKDA
jgi:HemY protein